MPSHYANAEVFVSNLDSDGDAEHVEELIQSALSSAGYQADVTVTAGAYDVAR